MLQNNVCIHRLMSAAVGSILGYRAAFSHTNVTGPRRQDRVNIVGFTGVACLTYTSAFILIVRRFNRN